MTLRLVDQQRRLGLFVEALLGRPLHLRAIEDDPAAPRWASPPSGARMADAAADPALAVSPERLTALDGLASAFTDGESLFLPERLDDQPLLSARAAYRIATLHQVGSLQAGSFRFRLGQAARRLGRPDLLEAERSRQRRLPGLPRLARDAALEHFFNLHPAPALLRRLFTLVEALRIDTWIAARYPGARSDLAAARAHALSRRPIVATAPPAARCVEALVRHGLGEVDAARMLGDRSGLAEAFRLLAARLDEVRVPGADVHDSAGIAWWLCARLLRMDGAETMAAAVATDPGVGEAIDLNEQGRAEAGGPTGEASAGEDEGGDGSGADRADADGMPDPADESDPGGKAALGDGGGGGDGTRLAELLAALAPGPPHHGSLRPERVHRRQLERAGPWGAGGDEADGDDGGEGDSEAEGHGGAEGHPDATGSDVDRERGPAGVASMARTRPTRARRPRPAAAVRSFLYDEWDWREQRYREAWCRVHEQTLAGADGSFIEEVRARHRPLIASIRRELLRVRPEARRRVATPGDGEELAWDRVLQARVEQRAGVCRDEYLYTRHERAGREIAAAFLIDLSASTDFPLPDPVADAESAVARAAGGANDADDDPGRDLLRDDSSFPYLYGGYPSAQEALAAEAARPRRRRVIDVAREAMAITSEALAALGDSIAIHGFSSDGRDQVDVLVAKDFDEPVSTRTWAMLAAMEPRRATRMAAAIRHSIFRLRRAPMRRRLLIVISDGYPEDRDYGPEARDDEYALQDTAQALREAEQAGIASFCITIDPAGHDYLRRMCAPERYLVIDSVEALPAELVKIYRSLTAEGFRPAGATAGAIRAVRPGGG